MFWAIIRKIVEFWCVFKCLSSLCLQLNWYPTFESLFLFNCWVLLLLNELQFTIHNLIMEQCQIKWVESLFIPCFVNFKFIQLIFWSNVRCFGFCLNLYWLFWNNWQIGCVDLMFLVMMITLFYYEVVNLFSFFIVSYRPVQTRKSWLIGYSIPNFLDWDRVVRFLDFPV